MSYTNYIREHYSEYSFNPPATTQQVDDLSFQIGGFPEELRAFLIECDGASIGDLITIFSIENRGGYTFKSVIDEWKDPEYKSLYPNAQKILFFADDGMGGFFGFIKLSDGKYGQIVYWNHETDEVTPLKEDDLKGFIRTCEEYLD